MSTYVAFDQYTGIASKMDNIHAFHKLKITMVCQKWNSLSISQVNNLHCTGLWRNSN